MALEKDKYVIIRIWTSRDNMQYPGEGVGHISLEISHPNTYMSLWPIPFTQEQIAEYKRAGTIKQNILKYFGERDANYKTKYEDDFKAENYKEPQLTICLYSLDREQMLIKFDALKDKKINSWRLIGSNLFVQNLEEFASISMFNVKNVESTVGKKNVDSCASFAYKLLKAGGIYNLISSAYSSNFSSVVTPDELANAVIAAKKYELKKNPETEGFNFPSETQIKAEDQQDKNLLGAQESSRCCIL